MRYTQCIYVLIDFRLIEILTSFVYKNEFHEVEYFHEVKCKGLVKYNSAHAKDRTEQ